MNKSFIALSIAMVVLTGTAFANTFKLKEGTDIDVELISPVSSATNNIGDRIHLKVSENVLSEDGKSILIEKGAPVKGIINFLEPKDKGGESGKVSISIRSTKAVDDSYVPLSGTLSRTEKDKDLTMSMFWWGIFATQRKGDDVTLPAGMPCTVTIDKDMEINLPDQPKIVNQQSSNTPAASVNTPK